MLDKIYNAADILLTKKYFRNLLHTKFGKYENLFLN